VIITNMEAVLEYPHGKEHWNARGRREGKILPDKSADLMKLKSDGSGDEKSFIETSDLDYNTCLKATRRRRSTRKTQAGRRRIR
jgi:hypothetical protein